MTWSPMPAPRLPVRPGDGAVADDRSSSAFRQAGDRSGSALRHEDALRLQLTLAPGPTPVLTARLSAAGPTPPRAALEARAERRVDLAGARTLSAEIGVILNRATRWGDDDQGSRELLRQRGELLFDTLLPLPIKTALRVAAAGADTRPIALELALDPALLPLPWELMHTGQRFLGLAFAIGRTTGPLGDATRIGRSAAHASGRALVLCDPRGDLIGSYYEGLTLRDELAQAASWEVDLRSSEVGMADVRRLLREYDLVHFAGHAEPGLVDATVPDVAPAERGWWLRDGVLGPSAIRELAGGRRFPRLVFSNACRSAGDATRVGDGGLAAAGLAGAFLEAGVEHYVGTVFDVPDEPASLFALTFYRTLRSDPRAGLGEAVRAARQALAERYGPDSIYWASWVLYGAPAARLEDAPGLIDDAIAENAPTPEPSRAPSDGGIAAIGARLRGVMASAGALAIGGARPVAAGLSLFWRGVAAALGVAALAAIAVMLLTIAGPPTPWTEGHGLARLGGPSPAPDLGLTPPARNATVVPRSAGDATTLEVVRRVVTDTTSDVGREDYRLRITTPESGFIALWRVDSRGHVSRIDRDAGDDEVLTEVRAGEIRELPADGAWWSIGTDGEADRYYLAWRQVEPSDRRAFSDELDQEIARIETALCAAAELGRAPREALDGLVGIREGASGEEIRERFEENLEDRFEIVVRRVVGSPR